MLDNSLDIRAAIAQILTGIEMIRMLHKMLADASRHAKTKVGIDIDLADRASCRFTKLIFRNADCVNQLAAVLVDDLDIFLRNRRRAVQNDREARKSLRDFIKNIKTKSRALCRV